MLIGQVAKETNLTKDTIRFYTKLGIIKADKRIAGNTFYSEYNEQTIGFLKEIKLARSIGFTLNEIRVLMPSAYDGSLTNSGIKKLLQHKLDQTRQKMKDLKQVEKILVNKLKKF